MVLIDKLPKNDEGQVVLSPGGEANGEYIEGAVDPAWFSENFPELANAEVPLTDEQYQALQNIDAFWKQNAERWRAEGVL